MDRGDYIVIGLLVGGIAYGLFRKRTPAGKTPKSTWAVLLVLAGLLGCLIVADTLGKEEWTFYLGMSLMAAVPVLLFFAVGSAAGSFLRPVKDNTDAAAKKKLDGVAVVCFAAAIVLCKLFPWFSAGSALLGVFFWVKSKRQTPQSAKEQD